MPLRNFPRGTSESRRGGGRSGMANGPPGSMGLPRCGGSGGSELPDRQYRKDCGSALDMIAELHLNGGIGIEQDIDARSEFDQADTLPASEPVSDLEVEN